MTNLQAVATLIESWNQCYGDSLRINITITEDYAGNPQLNLDGYHAVKIAVMLSEIIEPMLGYVDVESSKKVSIRFTK